MYIFNEVYIIFSFVWQGCRRVGRKAGIRSRKEGCGGRQEGEAEARGPASAQ